MNDRVQPRARREQRTGAVNQSDDASTDKSSESDQRVALGRALEERSDDIVRWCQLEYAKKPGVAIEDVPKQSWETVTLAVHSIANWLVLGVSVNQRDRAQIDSMGSVAATQHGDSAARDRSNAQSIEPGSLEQPRFTLSVALVTKLNLWWSEATQRVLVEEATRLGISQVVLDDACAMVVKSCYSSLVRMSKRYDEELRTLYERLARSALRDPLTGLANRAMLIDWLERSLARLERHPGGLVVAFMDVDDFKQINDEFGHACGDEVLVEVSSRLSRQVRNIDVVARFGGDEFVIVYGELVDPLGAATVFAQRLTSALDEPVCARGHEFAVTISVGMCVVQGPNCDADQLLVRADAAMYSAKKTGSTSIVVVGEDSSER